MPTSGPKPGSLSPCPTLAPGPGRLFSAANGKHIPVLILYLHIAARKATGSPGHKWLRILQAKNTHPLRILLNNKEGKLLSQMSTKPAQIIFLSPEAILKAVFISFQSKDSIPRGSFQTGV